MQVRDVASLHNMTLKYTRGNLLLKPLLRGLLRCARLLNQHQAQMIAARITGVIAAIN